MAAIGNETIDCCFPVEILIGGTNFAEIFLVSHLGKRGSGP